MYIEPAMHKAFNILAEQHRPMLCVYVAALLHGDVRDAEDVVQETFLTAYRQIEKFTEGGNFARWLRGIARNKVLEHCRSAGRTCVVTDSRILEGIEDVCSVLDGPAIGDESWHDRARRWLDHCIGQLSVHLKASIVRVYQQELTLAQAAEKEQTTFAAMAQRLSRSREQLRRCIQAQMEQES